MGYQKEEMTGHGFRSMAFCPERRKMMQAWADYLDGLKAGAEVIPLFMRA